MRKAQEVVELTSASAVQVCLIILTLLAIVYTLYFGAGIILPFVLALVLAMVLGPSMRVMNRRLRIPRMIAALLLIIALFSRGCVGLRAIGSRVCLDRQSPAIVVHPDG